MIISLDAKQFNKALESPTAGDLAILFQAKGLQRGDAYNAASDIRNQHPRKVEGVQIVNVSLPDWMEPGND